MFFYTKKIKESQIPFDKGFFGDIKSAS